MCFPDCRRMLRKINFADERESHHRILAEKLGLKMQFFYAQLLRRHLLLNSRKARPKSAALKNLESPLFL